MPVLELNRLQILHVSRLRCKSATGHIFTMGMHAPSKKSFSAGKHDDAPWSVLIRLHLLMLETVRSQLYSTDDGAAARPALCRTRSRFVLDTLTLEEAEQYMPVPCQMP